MLCMYTMQPGRHLLELRASTVTARLVQAKRGLGGESRLLRADSHRTDVFDFLRHDGEKLKRHLVGQGAPPHSSTVPPGVERQH